MKELPVSGRPTMPATTPRSYRTRTGTGLRPSATRRKVVDWRGPAPFDADPQQALEVQGEEYKQANRHQPCTTTPMTGGVETFTHWSNILVQVEEVLWVVFVFERNQSPVVISVSRLDAIFTLVPEIVHVDRARGERRHGRPYFPCPVDVLHLKIGHRSDLILNGRAIGPERLEHT